MNESVLFSEFSTYVDPIRLYFAYFKKIPSVKTIDGIDSIRFKKWINSERTEKIVDKNSKQLYKRKLRKWQDSEGYFLLDNNVLIYFEIGKVSVLYEYDQELLALEYMRQIGRSRASEGKGQEISLVVDGQNGIDTNSLKIKKPKLDLAIHYNDDLLSFHDKIVSSLKTKNKSGLYLLYGIPGTGKSTYIRYLVCSTKKKVIFMPPGLAGHLDSTQIAKMLLENENAIFVIEDAEELINSRDLGKNSAMSMLLNLTDGLLGDALGIQIIITFNTNPANLDKALMRKGRLIALYEFKPLSVSKARLLLNKTGACDYTVIEPMTLADLFHVRGRDYQFKNNIRNPIGFLVGAV